VLIKRRRQLDPQGAAGQMQFRTKRLIVHEEAYRPGKPELLDERNRPDGRPVTDEGLSGFSRGFSVASEGLPNVGELVAKSAKGRIAVQSKRLLFGDHRGHGSGARTRAPAMLDKTSERAALGPHPLHVEQVESVCREESLERPDHEVGQMLVIDGVDQRIRDYVRAI